MNVNYKKENYNAVQSEEDFFAGFSARALQRTRRGTETGQPTDRPT